MTMGILGRWTLGPARQAALAGMPDVVTVLRRSRPPARTATGGYTQDFAAHHTLRCLLTASILSGGDEAPGAGQTAALMRYTMNVPAGADITPEDRVQLGDTIFEVAAGKRASSLNISDSWTLTEIQR